MAKEEFDLSNLFSQEVPNLDFFDLRDTYAPVDKPFPPRLLEQAQGLWDHEYEESMNLIPNKTELHREVLDLNREKHDYPANSHKSHVKKFAQSMLNLGFSSDQMAKSLRFIFKSAQLRGAREDLKSLTNKTATEPHDRTKIIFSRLMDAGKIDKEVMFNIVVVAKNISHALELAQGYHKMTKALHVPQVITPEYQPRLNMLDFDEHPDQIDKRANYDALIKKISKIIKEEKAPVVKIFDKMASWDANLLESSVRASIIGKALDLVDEVHVDVFKGSRKSHSMTVLKLRTAKEGKLYPKKAAEPRPDYSPEQIHADYDAMFENQEFDATSILKEAEDNFDPTDVSFSGGMTID